MSTHIGTVTGRKEEGGNKNAFTPNYSDIELFITRFWGGTKRGRCIQLTIEDSYIQLTEEQVKELTTILSNAYDDTVYPGE